VTALPTAGPRPADATGSTLLEVDDVDARYEFLQVLWEVSIRVDRGEFVALLGPNGAGKTTILRTIAGLVAPTQGVIRYGGEEIQGWSPSRVSRLGISFVTEGLNLFPAMSVDENLLAGAYTVPDRAAREAALASVFELFPRLHERRAQLAGTLSGGERKMLAIGRGLMRSPTLLLVDEPSLGLAPMLTVSVFQALQQLRDRGMTILLVEQNVNTTLQLVDRAYVLEQGRVVLAGSGRELAENPHVREAYLGV
jgi:branched-chain amino acid transport system ATP-binding protein